jgi:hypothetical protein
MKMLHNCTAIFIIIKIKGGKRNSLFPALRNCTDDTMCSIPEEDMSHSAEGRARSAKVSAEANSMDLMERS